MHEFDEILDSVRAWSAQGRPFALATVVGTRGSTYREPGARQLVAADGASVGTVSGGCLDADLHRVASQVMADGRALLVTFDLTSDDEAVWGWGIGCNGATELLVEPATTASALVERIGEARGTQRPMVVIHVLEGERATPGERAFLFGEGPPEGSLDISVPMAEQARAALAAGHSEVAAIDGRRLFLEVVGAPSRLLVCGAGHDAAPLVRHAAELGFEVTVVDDRRQFLTRDRFPEATSLVHAPPAEAASLVGVDQRTYAVIMSHNYLRDVDYLRSLIGTEVAYIGTLGPGARLERLLKDLEAAGATISESDLAKMHGPAGLDVGAEGPVEIAWAVMAEIVAVRRRRRGGFLRDRKGPVALRHHR